MAEAPISSDLGSSMTDRLASTARETIDRVAPKANRAEHELRVAATKAADSAKLLQEHAVEAAKVKLRAVRSYAEANPLGTAAIAFAAGVLVSTLARR